MKKNKLVAFTLLELLIVLGIIVALMGMGFPVLQRMYVRSQLKATTQELQSELYRIRLEAMKSGKAQVFRYRFGSSTYEILPKEIFDQREKDKTGLGAVSVGPGLLENDEPPDGSWTDGSEDFTNGEDTVTFYDKNGSGSLYEKTLPYRILFGELNAASGAWSTPVLFYPNGRISQTSIVLRMSSPYVFREELMLRGLTGTAQIVGQ